MNVSAPASRARDSHISLIVVLAALALGLLWFVVQRIHYLTDYSPASYTPYYWPRRAGLVTHLTGGALAITAGLVQIWLGLTNRVGTLHRILGRVYAVGVLTGSVGGFYLAVTIPGPWMPARTSTLSHLPWPPSSNFSRPGPRRNSTRRGLAAPP